MVSTAPLRFLWWWTTGEPTHRFRSAEVRSPGENICWLHSTQLFSPLRSHDCRGSSSWACSTSMSARCVCCTLWLGATLLRMPWSSLATVVLPRKKPRNCCATCESGVSKTLTTKRCIERLCGCSPYGRLGEVSRELPHGITDFNRSLIYVNKTTWLRMSFIFLSNDSMKIEPCEKQQVVSGKSGTSARVMNPVRFSLAPPTHRATPCR